MSYSIVPSQLTHGQERFVSWVSDVLVYILVLNLFVEWVEPVVIESFTISIFTAVVLKFLLDLIIGFEHWVHDFFTARDQRVVGVVATLAILFFSKFVILEAIDIVFGARVELGGFFTVMILVIAMMAARAILRLVYQRLGGQKKKTLLDPKRSSGQH